MALKLADYKTDVHNDWCPGCGDFGIVNAIQMALMDMQIPRHKAAIFTGIGCSGKALTLFIPMEYIHYTAEFCRLPKELNCVIPILKC